MPGDPTVQVAIVGVLATLITTLGVVFVAVINNRKERGGAADEGVEAALRERLTLRDEQLADLRADVAELEAKLARAGVRNQELQQKLDEMREKLGG